MPSQNHIGRVLIVGAGPTGLTAAVELARRGVEVQVIDRKSDPSSLSRAVGILPNSLRLLAPSGVSEELLAQGVKLREVLLFRGAKLWLNISLRGGDSEHGHILALAQDRTEAVLRGALSRLGVEVGYGRELTDLKQAGGLASIQTSDGKGGDYDWVIGADGVRSATRKFIGLDFPGFTLQGKWSIADVDATGWPHADVFSICVLKNGNVAVVAPMEANRFRVVSNTPDALAALPLEMNVSRIRREAQFDIGIRQVSQYRVGRVLLAGDAAHCHSPVGGRGMNLGIADAAELARRMVEGSLDDYSRSRHRVGRGTIAESERARRMATSTSPVIRAGFLAGCRFVNAAPFLHSAVARQLLGG